MKAAFEPHKVKQEELKALHDGIIITDMVFTERITQSGLILPTDNGTGAGIRPRWGRVYAVGPKQKDVQVGQWVCVAHGRWTRGIDIEDGTGKRQIRRIDPNDILLVADTDEAPTDETMSTAVNAIARTRE
jgi:co-chaperonin GroES (HSP10)